MISIFLEIDLALQDAPSYVVIGLIVAIDCLLKGKQRAKAEHVCYAVLIAYCCLHGVHVLIIANSKLGFVLCTLLTFAEREASHICSVV